MSLVSTATLTPSASTSDSLGVGAVAEQPLSPQLLERVADPGYAWWLEHVMPAAACSQPIRLTMQAQRVDDVGRIIEIDRLSDSMPDGVLYVACKNRRASVCPGCAATYRADMYQLIKAGLLGGKGVPDTVITHPCLFVTLTAPSFGLVHTPSTAGKPRPCTPRRHATRCPHGVIQACWHTHSADDPAVGTPLCRDCYDYQHQAVWNLHAGELWRRTTITLHRHLGALARSLGTRVRVQYAKVAEYQARGAVHFHALIRLDGHNQHDPDAVLSPPPEITTDHLEAHITEAVTATGFTTTSHPSNQDGWLIEWGEQLDVRTVRLSASDLDDHGLLTTTAVAGYLAKYATKATEITGHTSKRLTDTDIRRLTGDTHQHRQLRACWQLGQRPFHLTKRAQREEWDATWGRLQRWAHMLGYGGHFATKSRRYSTTLTALRNVRRAYQLGQQPDQPAPPVELPRDHDQAGEHAEVVITHTFEGTGWLTMADAQLANTAAARAREQRYVAKQEIACQPA